MRKVHYVVLCAVLVGCAQQPKMLWLRADGQRASDDPALRTQYELDSTSCLGERNKANLSGVTFANGSLAGLAAAQNRSDAADTVQRGCMAEKGYLFVPEDQAPAKQAELAAIAQQKRQQELAAAAPAPTPPKRKPPPPLAKPAQQPAAQAAPQ
ncbi:MAG: hypothetical protein ABSG88_15055 [Bradyrhizobium sp.]